MLNKPILLLLFTWLLLNSQAVLSQDLTLSKYNLQLSIGLSRTFHYNQPVSLFFCHHGCEAEVQESRSTPNINLSFYRVLTKKSSLKIGVGKSSYKYWEKGMYGGFFNEIYEITPRWSYYDLSVGYRYVLIPQSKVQLFIENDIVLQIPVKDDSVVHTGLAIKPKLGIIISLSKNLSLIGEGFYKSALTKYNVFTWGNNYFPYAYGVQFGVNFNF